MRDLITKHKNKFRSEEAFSLVELVVVILIIGIITAIAIPVFLEQQKEAHRSTMKSDVTNTASSLVGWQQTHGWNTYPDGGLNVATYWTAHSVNTISCNVSGPEFVSAIRNLTGTPLTSPPTTSSPTDSELLRLCIYYQGSPQKENDYRYCVDAQRNISGTVEAWHYNVTTEVLDTGTCPTNGPLLSVEAVN